MGPTDLNDKMFAVFEMILLKHLSRNSSSMMLSLSVFPAIVWLALEVFSSFWSNYIH